MLIYLICKLAEGASSNNHRSKCRPAYEAREFISSSMPTTRKCWHLARISTRSGPSEAGSCSGAPIPFRSSPPLSAKGPSSSDDCIDSGQKRALQGKGRSRAVCARAHARAHVCQGLTKETSHAYIFTRLSARLHISDSWRSHFRAQYQHVHRYLLASSLISRRTRCVRCPCLLRFRFAFADPQSR